MKKQNNDTTNAARLRQKAQALLAAKTEQKLTQHSEGEMLKLIHELEVHQIELELQNEELLLAKARTQEVLEQYSELYEFAPTGYFTLSKQGKIIALNFCGAGMLGKERSKLVGNPLGFFVSDESKLILLDFLARVFSSSTKQSCEISLAIRGKMPDLHYLLSGIILKNTSHCLVSTVDISKSWEAQKNIHKHCTSQELLNRISTAFINSKSSQTDQAFDFALEDIATFTGANRSALFILSNDQHFITNTNEWCSAPEDSQIKLLQNIPFSTFGYHQKELLAHRTIAISRLNDYPPKAKGEIAWMEKHGFRSLLFIPLLKKKKLLGTVGIYGELGKEIAWLPETIDMLLSAGNMILNAFLRRQAEENFKNTHKRLQQLYIHQEEIKENERKRISREIHDELGQSLTALKIDLGWMMDKAGTNPVVNEKIRGMTDIVSDTIKTVQRISSDLRPGMLDDLGLVPAMEWYCQEFEKRSKIVCLFTAPDIPVTCEKLSLAIYRILQEALTNVVRHARATNVWVELCKEEDALRMSIADDGIGMPPEKINSGVSLGILGMRERVNQFNGTFTITPGKHKGTKLNITIPER